MYKTVLKIEGMACNMCEVHINNCIRQNFVIKKVRTSHFKGETEIISAEPLDEELLKKVIYACGYSIVSIGFESYTKKGLFHKG